jgi:hypothetical protein
MADGEVEIERYQSAGGVEVQPEFLDEFFADLEDN